MSKATKPKDRTTPPQQPAHCRELTCLLAQVIESDPTDLAQVLARKAVLHEHFGGDKDAAATEA
jgi:hypothetical protein